MAAKALKSLKEFEVDATVIEANKSLELQSAISWYLDERSSLCEQRRALVTGKQILPENDSKGSTKRGTASGPTLKKGVPYFWLNVLCNNDALAPHITSRDKMALEYLEDVAFERGSHGMVVEFHFSPTCPFFSNTILRRGIYVEHDASGNVCQVRDEGTAIHWHEGKCLTERAAAAKKSNKKGKKGGAGADAAAKPSRARAVPSFFHFFNPVTQSGARRNAAFDPVALDSEPEEGQESEDDDASDKPGAKAGARKGPEAEKAGGGSGGKQSEKRQQADAEILDALIKSVIPRAVHLYMADTSQGSQPAGGSDEEGEDEDGFAMVSGNPGSPAHTLPLATQRVMDALKVVQQQMDELAMELKRREWEAARKADEAQQELARKRREILNSDDGSSPLPHFWSRCLRALPSGHLTITSRDAAVLANLADVRWRWDWSHMPTVEEPWRRATLELEFLPSTAIQSDKLSKVYTFECPNGSLNKMRLSGSTSTPLLWVNDTLDPTVKVDGEVKQPCKSFFCLFLEGGEKRAFGSKPKDMSLTRAEEEVITDLQSVLTRQPSTLYSMVDSDLESDEEDEGGSDDDSDDNNDVNGDDGDEDPRSGKSSGSRRPRQAAGSTSSAQREAVMLFDGRLLVGVLLVIMVAYQFVWFMEYADFWRSTF